MPLLTQREKVCDERTEKYHSTGFGLLQLVKSCATVPQGLNIHEFLVSGLHFCGLPTVTKITLFCFPESTFEILQVNFFPINFPLFSASLYLKVLSFSTHLLTTDWQKTAGNLNLSRYWFK